MTNVAYLRSGLQFGDPAMTLSAPGNQSPGAKLSSSQRLAQFFRQTQQAAADAKARREAQGSTTSSAGLNVDFIRSGRQFVDAGHASSAIRAREPGQRLRDFVAQTASAAACAPGADQSPEALVAFLRTGQHLDATAPSPAVVATSRRAPRDDAGDASPEAIIAFLRSGRRLGAQAQTQDPGPAINISFLRSGMQFNETLAASSESYLLEQLMSGARPQPGERVRRFVALTQAAAAAAAAAATTDTAQGPAGPPALNVSFLRSGLQLKVQQSNAERDPRDEYPRNHRPAYKTRAQRLQEFYKKTLLAASPRAARKMHAAMAADVKSTPTPSAGINIRLLQSGAPLAARTRTSTRTRPSPPARDGAGPRRTKQQRLEAFYQRTLLAASPREARQMRARVEAAPTIVSLKYLQSGFGFRPNTTGAAAALGAPWSESPAGQAESGSMYEEEAESASEAAERIAKRTTKAERAKAFYTATQQSATEASRLAAHAVA